ncbi:unnamed protein product, partial [marine sediment metagenome]
PTSKREVPGDSGPWAKVGLMLRNPGVALAVVA